MSGEMGSEPSGWTTDTLKLLHDRDISALFRFYAAEIRRLEGLQVEHGRRVEQATESAQTAIGKAEAALGRRLDLLNEFRAQAGDEARKYAQKEQVDDQLEGLRESIEIRYRERVIRQDKLETQVARLYGGLAAVAGIAVAVTVKLFLG